MAKEKKERVSITKYDPVEDPEDVIAADKDVDRREAFKKTYEVIAKIVPNYFMEQRRKRKNGTSGGTALNPFSQKIIVTPEKTTLETKEVKAEESKDMKKEKERD